MMSAPSEASIATMQPSMGVTQSPSCGVLWALTPIGFVGMSDNDKSKQSAPTSTEAPQSGGQNPLNGLGPIVSNLDGTNMRQLPANTVQQNSAMGNGLVLPSLGQIPNAMSAGQFVSSNSPMLPFVVPYGQMGQQGGIVLPANGSLDANTQLALQAAQSGMKLEGSTNPSTANAMDSKNMPGLADLHALAQLAMVQGAGLAQSADVKSESVICAHGKTGGQDCAQCDSVLTGKPAQEKCEHRKLKKNCKDCNGSNKAATYAKQVAEDVSEEDDDDSGDEGSDGKKGSKPKRKRRDRSKSVWWTPEEHQKFLEGLAKFGSNDSLGPGGAELISLYMGTRSVLQVRSHAQKHFLRTRTGKG
mmetsp:Transcript_1012/g.2248  ORF Transcript_1012/g.2248 Transcript_1012/m.2248 type:complete len:359 (-) Transcript_1012:84-1160(-)